MPTRGRKAAEEEMPAESRKQTQKQNNDWREALGFSRGTGGYARNLGKMGTGIP